MKFLKLLLLCLVFVIPAFGQSPNGAYSSPLAGSGTTTANLCSGANCFNPQNYAGWHGNTREVLDATWTGGTNAISCPNSDCAFTPAMTGWLCWAMPASGNAAGPSAPGTFTYVSANSATCTASAVISSATANGMFTWGQDDTPAYLAAAAALYTQPKCGTIIIPAARSMISQGMSFTGTVAGDCAIAVTGQGYASVIEMEPGFSFSAVTNSVGCIAAGCIFNSGALSQYLYFTVNGEYQSLSGISTAPASNLFTIGAGSYSIGVNLMNWATAASNSPIGLQTNGNFAFSIGTALTNWGNSTFVCNVPFCFYQYDGGTNNSIQNPGGNSTSLDWAGGYVGGYNKSGGTFIFYGTQTGANNGPFGSIASDVGTINVLHDASIGTLGTGLGTSGIGWEFFTSGSGSQSVLDIERSTFQGGSSGAAIKSDAAGTGVIIDRGNNKFIGPMTFQGTYSNLTSLNVKGACTGTATSSSTLGLYGTGPNVTTTTCTTTTIGSGIVMTKAYTIYELLTTATHAGVNASSGVVTVLKNGSTQSMTCTIGTGTACQDGATAHQVTGNAGDLISIQFTTQATEVLAGVQASLIIE